MTSPVADVTPLAQEASFREEQDPAVWAFVEEKFKVGSQLLQSSRTLLLALNREQRHAMDCYVLFYMHRTAVPVHVHVEGGYT